MSAAACKSHAGGEVNEFIWKQTLTAIPAAPASPASSAAKSAAKRLAANLILVDFTISYCLPLSEPPHNSTEPVYYAADNVAGMRWETVVYNHAFLRLILFVWTFTIPF